MIANSNETDLRAKARSLRALIKRRQERIRQLRLDKENAAWKLREIERQLKEYAR